MTAVGGQTLHEDGVHRTSGTYQWPVVDPAQRWHKMATETIFSGVGDLCHSWICVRHWCQIVMSRPDIPIVHTQIEARLCWEDHAMTFHHPYPTLGSPMHACHIMTHVCRPPSFSPWQSSETPHIVLLTPHRFHDLHGCCTWVSCSKSLDATICMFCSVVCWSMARYVHASIQASVLSPWHPWVASCKVPKRPGDDPVYDFIQRAPIVASAFTVDVQATCPCCLFIGPFCPMVQ